MTPGQRLLIVDDHPVVRRGLRTLLECLPWVEEIVEAATADEALRETMLRPIHVVAMDIELGDGQPDGIEAVRRIHRARPDVRILMLTMFDEVNLLQRAVAAGAHGYVLKDTEPANLISALESVAGGSFVLGPGVSPDAFRAAGPAVLAAPFDRLSDREISILKRLAAGDSNAQIGHKLSLAEKTVRNQLSDIYTKIGVADRTQAALRAREAGIEP